MNAINQYLNRFKINTESSKEESINENTKNKLPIQSNEIINEKNKIKNHKEEKNLNINKNITPNNLNPNNNNIQKNKIPSKPIDIEQVINYLVDKNKIESEPNDELKAKDIPKSKLDKEKRDMELKIKKFINKKNYHSDNEKGLFNGKTKKDSSNLEEAKGDSRKTETEKANTKKDQNKKITVNNFEINEGNNNINMKKEYKGPYLNKSRFNLKRALKFKNEEETKVNNFPIDLNGNTKLNASITNQITKNNNEKTLKQNKRKIIDSDNNSSEVMKTNIADNIYKTKKSKYILLIRVKIKI